MPQRFQIGQRVRLVRPDALTERGDYSMRGLFGRVATIRQVRNDKHPADCFYIGEFDDIDGGGSYWLIDNMLDPLTPKRSTGAEYRLVMEGRGCQVFVDPGLTNPQDVADELWMQTCGAAAPRVALDSTLDLVKFSHAMALRV